VPDISISAMVFTASFLEGEGLETDKAEEAEEPIFVGVAVEREPALAGEGSDLVELPVSRAEKAAVIAV